MDKTFRTFEITVDRVQEAARTCPDAAKVLKTLFPEAFPRPLVAGAQLKRSAGWGNETAIVLNDTSRINALRGYGRSDKVEIGIVLNSGAIIFYKDRIQFDQARWEIQ